MKRKRSVFDTYFDENRNISVDDALFDWRCWMPVKLVKCLLKNK